MSVLQPMLMLQVNPAGDFIYTSTSATPVDDSFTYEATGVCAQQQGQMCIWTKGFNPRNHSTVSDLAHAVNHVPLFLWLALNGSFHGCMRASRLYVALAAAVLTLQLLPC